MSTNNYVEGRTKEQLVADITDGITNPVSPAHEQRKAAIIVRCTEDLEKAIYTFADQVAENTKAEQRLGKQVLILNIILGFFTVAGVILAIIQMMR